MLTSNQMSFFGVATLVLGTIGAVACSSTTPAGTGGSTTGTASTGTTTPTTTTGGGGSVGTTSTTTGTTTSSTSTSTSTSTSSGAPGCPTSVAPPSANILAAGDGGLALYGGLTSYGPGATAPTATTTDLGALDITESGAASATMIEYAGQVVYFSGDAAGLDCVTASTYTGVQFTLSGTISGCTVVFTINDSEHSAASTADPKASGASTAYPGTVSLTPTSTATLVQVPFVGTGAPTGGMPASAIDPTKLESISWQYVIPEGTGTCTSSLTISDIAFYP
jgi:hypothetical protein